MPIEATFVKYAADKLAQLRQRIGTCAAKLTPEQIWARQGENENAIGNLVLHLDGNVRQWILSGIGGEPNARDRDAEFAARSGVDGATLAARLGSTVEKAVEMIRALPPERLTDRITVQGYDTTVLEAIFHVVEHFSEHVGQIIFVTKFLTGEDLAFYGHLKTVKAHSEKTP